MAQLREDFRSHGKAPRLWQWHVLAITVYQMSFWGDWQMVTCGSWTIRYLAQAIVGWLLWRSWLGVRVTHWTQTGHAAVAVIIPDNTVRGCATCRHYCEESRCSFKELDINRNLKQVLWHQMSAWGTWQWQGHSGCFEESRCSRETLWAYFTKGQEPRDSLGLTAYVWDEGECRCEGALVRMAPPRTWLGRFSSPCSLLPGLPCDLFSSFVSPQESWRNSQKL